MFPIAVLGMTKRLFLYALYYFDCTICLTLTRCKEFIVFLHRNATSSDIADVSFES